MAKIRIFSDLATNKVSFEGSRLSSKDIGSVEVEAHPSQSNRVIIKSNRLFKRGSDTEYRVFFKRLNIDRIQNREGQDLTAAPLFYDRDQVIDYLETQFKKPVVNEYFEYNPVTDRLVAKKDIEVAKNGFFLGGKHKMASGNSNIYFEDLGNRANAYPIFGEVLDQSLAENQLAGAGVTKPKSRIFSDFQSIPLGGSPVNDTAIPYDGNNFFPFNISGVGITTRVAEVVAPTQQLKYEIVIDGISVYVQYLEHNGLAINEDLTWYFEQPLDVENGTTLRATIYKVSTVNNQEQNDGILLVCEGDDVNTRYQTNVLNRFFEDEEIALKSDINTLLSGSTYKGSYNAATDTPSLPTGTDVLGDFYRVTAAGNGYDTGDILVFNGTDYDHIAEENATQSDIKNSGLKIYDIYVKAGYAGAVQDGSVLYPFASIETALATTIDGDSIYIEGSFEITSEIELPQDQSLYFYGSDDACISFTNYNESNGSLLYFNGLDNTKELKFRNIKFHNAGAYGLYLKKTSKVTIEDCEFINNGWNGTALNTVLPSTTTTLLGYDSTNTELQAFYAGPNASNGGAMRIEEATQILITGNYVKNNLRGIRVQDCGINGGGFISRNQSTQNIESGIYIAAGALGGCHNITTTMNVSAYNANNGMLVIGGINNKFSQNEVNGNWNAGFCAWGSANTTLRDSGLYDNNRSQYNGIGNTGDAKASIQINEIYNLLGTQITLNPAFRFIAEILDTQVHYTGLGSNTEKIGFLITSAVGELADNEKNIIKIDDVGFIGQDYAIDLSEVDVTNLRLSLGDNSYQSIALSAVKPPLAGNYSELPFSNHIMSVPSVDVSVDTLKQTIALKDGVGGNVINVYAINELKSNVVGGSIQIIQKNSDKIQLRGLNYGSIYINGVLAGNDLNSANDSLNAAFEMDLVQYKSFLVSEVGVNGDDNGGGSSFPDTSNDWYISYGGSADTLIPTSTIGNAYRNHNPFYNGNQLQKGREFIWTNQPEIDYQIGIWGGAQSPVSGGTALNGANWLVSFKFEGATRQDRRYFNGNASSGVTIQSNSNTAQRYNLPTFNTLALRYGNDGFLYLYEFEGGTYKLIGRSDSQIPGNPNAITIQWGSYNEGTFPTFVERTDTWEIVHDYDNTENGEWSNGLEAHSVIKSRMFVSPGQKITLNFNYFGRTEKIGFGYSGAATGVTNAEDTLDYAFFYNTSEVLKEVGASENNWTWNTDAANSYDPNGNGNDIGYDGRLNPGNELGLISFRYMSDNSVELWHETNNELIATKKVDLDGSPFHIYWGANEGTESAPHAANRIPSLTLYDMSAEDVGTKLTGWYYIQSPDGEYYYPLFASEGEAAYIDGVEGGSGTTHTHTFVDDTVWNGGGNTWYMPDTNGVHAGSSAPQHGIWGNSINILWNEIPTEDDANFLPTFNNITYNVQEGEAVNIQYKAQGMTDTFNVTGVPNGYADNGFAIIGTAEDISNGYGQSITHVLNVTKANSFGSVQGTITINVLADLAGNEFTLVDQNGAIKFTQDGGLTILDFNTVTFNAGSTYKFYIDGPTLQTNDIVNIVDENGNGITGNDGLTQMGAGAGYAGAHFQYVIPSDVSPGKKIKFTDGATNTAYADVPLTIAGSTWTNNVTGIDLEGPAVNQSGTVIVPANGYNKHGWISLDETLGQGQRLILSNDFFTDLLSYATTGAGYSYYEFCIGLKGDNWVNTLKTSGSTQQTTGIFKGDAYLHVRVGFSSEVRIKAFAGNSTSQEMLLNTAAQHQTACAFIDITNSGNNIRIGFGKNGYGGVTAGSESTTLYSDWNSYKVQTGDQGYGINALDVLFLAHNTYAGTAEFDADEIDWTQLTEIAVPQAPIMDTNWSKALDFSGGNEHLKQVSTASAVNVLRMQGIAQYVGNNSDVSKTSNDTYSRPYMVSTVFNVDGHSSNQHIWNSGEGSGSTDDNVYLRVAADRRVYFGWGRGSTNNECQIMTATTGQWYGVAIVHKGARFSTSNANTTNLANAFDIWLMTENDFVNGTALNVSTTGNWVSTGARMDRGISGDFTIGGRGSNRSFHGKVASMLCTTLRRNVEAPNSDEIVKFISDPQRWVTDYRVGQTVRSSSNASEGTFISYSSSLGWFGTQMWLMGDGGSDSYANGIRSEIYATDQNYTKLQLNSMVSNDIVNVSITGLS